MCAMCAMSKDDPAATENLRRRRWDWTAIGAIVTGLTAIGALIFTGLSLRATQDQIMISEQGQLTDRFSKAVEQLGSKDGIDVRLGGIYALERLARDSARDHPAIMEVLSAFVRQHAPITMCTNEYPPATDIQAALTVVGRRDAARDAGSIDLRSSCLAKANLSGVNLSRANLAGAYLTDAQLSNIDFTGTRLIGAKLGGADLTGAHLGGANLTGAYVSGADLAGANLSGADLTGVNLSCKNHLACHS